MSKSKKADLIFVGPMAAGKTTLFQVLQGNVPPTKHEATISNGRIISIWTIAKPKFFGLLKGKVSIIDAGGKNTEFNKYKEYCNKAEKIIIVFNGVDFLKEVDNCKNGGESTSFCKMLLSQLHEIDASNLFFVATHADLYTGNSSMCEEIIKRIEQANNEYQTLSNSKRYPMKNDMPGRLYEVNATDPASVQNVFSSILNQ